MDQHASSVTSLQISNSNRKRSGRYGLPNVITRANSSPTEAQFSSSSTNCEVLSMLTCDLFSARNTSVTKYNKIDNIDYIANFNNLNLGDSKISLASKSMKCYLGDCSQSSSPLYKQYSIPCDNFDTVSHAQSICTNSSFEDFQQAEPYISSINRSLKRRKMSSSASFAYSDSSDVSSQCSVADTEVNAINSFASNKSMVTNLSSSSEPDISHFPSVPRTCIIRSAIYGILRIFIALAVCFLAIFLIIFLISFVIQYKISTCSVTNSVSLPGMYIKNNLTQCLVGQEIAISLLADSLERYNLGKFKNGLLWIVGSIGVGKSKSFSLIQKSLGNQIKLHSVYESLLPSDSHLLQNIALKLVNEFDSCRPNVVMYDEYDGENVGVKFFTLVLQLLKLERNIITYRTHMKTLFIISGSYKHEVILESFVKHITSGGQRHSFDSDKLSNTLLNLLPFRDLHFDFNAVVPFLPLEEEHIVKCINQEISLSWKNKICTFDFSNRQNVTEFLKSKNLSLQYIYDTVKMLTNMSPYDYKNIVMTSGCKRVQKTVSLLLTKV